MQRSGWHLMLLASAALFQGGCDSPRTPSITLELQPKASVPAFGPGEVQLPGFEASEVPTLGGIDLVADPATLPLARRWAGGLERDQPRIRVVVLRLDPKGPTDRWHGRFGLVLLDRAMAPRDLALFRHTYGYSPRHLRAAMDPVVVVVHRENPIAAHGLTLKQLRGLFGATHPSHGPRSWGDLGNVAEEWRVRPIRRYGSEALSPTLRGVLLRESEFGPAVRRLHGSSAVADAVAGDVAAIGLTTIGGAGDAVKVVPVAEATGAPFVLPDAVTAPSGEYPLPAGFYHLYIAQPPVVALDAPRRELVRFIYSHEGQRLVADGGLVPLSAAVVAEELKQQEIRLVPEDVRLAAAPVQGAAGSWINRPTVSTTGAESHSRAPK